MQKKLVLKKISTGPATLAKSGSTNVSAGTANGGEIRGSRTSYC